MIRVNLLPAEEAERATARRQHLAVGSLALGVVVFILVAAHVWQGARFSAARRRLGRLNQEITNLAGTYGDVTRMEQQKRELREKLRVIAQLEARKVGPVKILADLSGAAPDKLWLTEFADAGGTLKLTGLGSDEQTVADFLRRLGTLPLFRTVDLDETSQVDQEGVKLKKFVIRAQLDYGSPVGPAQTAGGKTPSAKGAKGAKR
ncbi:MAG: PilN domain-containing protein [Thermoanaerobaculia bacterium]